LVLLAVAQQTLSKAPKTDIHDLWNELLDIDSKIASHKKGHFRRIAALNKSTDDIDLPYSRKSRNFNPTETLIADTQYLTQKLTKISEITLDPKKSPITAGFIQTKQHFIAGTEINSNIAYMVVYPHELVFYDLSGNLISLIYLNYEILLIKESMGSDNTRTIDIISKDLFIHSYNLISYVPPAPKNRPRVKGATVKAKSKSATVKFKLQLRVTIDLIRALDMGMMTFQYFLDPKVRKISFTNFEISIQRKARQFFLGDSQGNVYHIGLDGKLKGQYSPQANYRNSNQSKKVQTDFSDQKILKLWSVNPFNAWVTPKGLSFFAPYSMNKTVDCIEPIDGDIITTTISTLQINLYFLMTDKGWIYVKYIKSGQCLTAAKLGIKSDLNSPQMEILKNMLVVSKFFPGKKN
jgi:hypothetical protein